MQLITNEIEKRLPPLYATENDKDPTVQLKLFTPDAQCTWLITEYDPAQDLAFGFATLNGLDGELGYISIAEIRTVRGRFGLPVERDKGFSPKPLSEAKRDASIRELASMEMQK